MTYDSHTIDEFLARIASETVSPAGGTATAVVGAIGTSLCEMACIHTVERDECPEVAADLADVREQLQRQRYHLLRLAEADATVVDEVFSTGEVPDQSGVKRSVGIPITVAVACGTVLELATDVAADCTRNAVADAGTGMMLAHAALRAAVFTARHNVDLVSDRSFVDTIERRATDLETRADDASERVMGHVAERSGR